MTSATVSDFILLVPLIWFNYMRKFIWGRGTFLRLCPLFSSFFFLLWGCHNISTSQNVTYFGFGAWLKNHRFRLTLCVMIVLLLLPALIFRSGLLNFTCMSAQAFPPTICLHLIPPFPLLPLSFRKSRCWASIYALSTCPALARLLGSRGGVQTLRKVQNLARVRSLSWKIAGKWKS